VTLSTLVAGKMENGYASHRRRWSIIGTTPTAVITYAPHRQRVVARRILFFVSRLVQGLSRTSLGHDVRLIPAQYVKPFLKGHKNDYRDAEAIAEAVLD
jgi:hypothetical protein